MIATSEANPLVKRYPERAHCLGRSYDPTIARFTSMDSIYVRPGDTINSDLYAYVRDNPINASDPSGHGEFSLVNLLIVGGIRGLLVGIVLGGLSQEISYFIGTPTDQWSTTGALVAFGKGAATGAFGATLIGSGYFAIQGVYNGIQVWRDPNASGLQKALASVNILIGVASAALLKGQVRSQWLEWQNLYSKVPLSTTVQTDLKAIRAAFNEGKDSVKIGETTISFADNPKAYGGTYTTEGGATEFYITKQAVEADDETLMKTIIEENIHKGRIVGGYLTEGLNPEELGVSQETERQTEEDITKGLTDDIYQRGQQAGWW